MGFAVSALLSQALADEGRYGIALTGDVPYDEPTNFD